MVSIEILSLALLLIEMLWYQLTSAEAVGY